MTSVCTTSVIFIGLLFFIEDVVNLDVITQTEALTRLKMQPTSQLITPTLSLKNILTDVTHHDVTNLHGLLHLIVLAIHAQCGQTATK